MWCLFFLPVTSLVRLCTSQGVRLWMLCNCRRKKVEHAHTLTEWKDWFDFLVQLLTTLTSFVLSDRNVSSIWTTWASLNCSPCWASWKESWRPETWSSRPWGWVQRAPFSVRREKTEISEVKSEAAFSVAHPVKAWRCDEVIGCDKAADLSRCRSVK